MTLTHKELWRLSDELSVIDATILITGNDPSEKEEIYDEDGHVIRDEDGRFCMRQKTDYHGFDPVFKALRNAIFSNKLAATLGIKARSQRYNFEAYGNPEVRMELGEVEFDFDVLIRASGYTTHTFTNRRIDNNMNASKFYLLDEPLWTETMLNVDELRDWLSERGIYPEFFFPKGKADGFRDKTHPRYSAKLACAVAAWEAVSHAQPNKSVKETISAWVMSNAVSFGLSNTDGIVPKLSVEEVAKVVNWAISGGATPTQSVEPKSPSQTEINNFYSTLNPQPDPDIPF